MNVSMGEQYITAMGTLVEILDDNKFKVIKPGVGSEWSEGLVAKLTFVSFGGWTLVSKSKNFKSLFDKLNEM